MVGASEGVGTKCGCDCRRQEHSSMA